MVLRKVPTLYFQIINCNACKNTFCDDVINETDY